MVGIYKYFNLSLKLKLHLKNKSSERFSKEQIVTN